MSLQAGCLVMTPGKIKRWPCLVLIHILTLPSGVAYAEDADRQAEVARRGAEVMPFSLEKTLHQFTKTETGGVQRVVSRDPRDKEQVDLIQQHLQSLADGFKRGDYTGPEHIHGADMPGLAQLRQAKPGGLHISYAAEPSGASLSFRSDDALLIKAVHDWFDAQVHDHGRDAMEVHRHHP